MADNKKIILDHFQTHLLNSYRLYCAKHEVGEDIEDFLTYIIDQNLIPSTEIKRYTIIREFGKVYPHKGRHKTKAVIDLADRFHISERSIWNMLRQNIADE